MGAKRGKCPLCNRKLAEVNGVLTCPDCGYRDPQTAGAAYGDCGAGYTACGEPEKGKEKTKARGGRRPTGKFWATFGSVCAAVAVGIGLSFAKRGLADALVAAVDAIADRQETAESTQGGGGADSGRDGASGSRKDGEQSSSASGGKVQTYRVPESEFLIMLLEELFGRPVGQISYEEMCSIIYLDVYELDETDVLAVDVAFADESSASYLLDDVYVDTADFACLEGLQYLYLETGSMGHDTDWHSLKDLWALSCDASLEDLAGYMDVSQLMYLETEDTFFMNDLSVLEKYTSLEYLKLDADTLSSIAGVSRAASLKGLYIEDGDRISDFSELYDMPWLEELSIESRGLKDIGFVSGMENLQYLALKGTEVRTLDALADCADTLTALCLDENDFVEDISPVFSCTGLERLELWAEYQFDVPMEAPDLSAMTNLTSLTIHNYDKFANLALLTGLTELTIECPGSGDGEPLKQLTNLKTLNLQDMSVYDTFMDGVASLENLEVLNLEDCFIWSDISPVFGLPNLQELNLEWTECGLSREKLTVSESLRGLNLSHTTFDAMAADGSWDYGYYDTALSMQEALEALAPCMPGMERLYVPGQELENLGFAENLPNLLLLDVSDNYITDLSPLMGLERLVVVMCEDNPVRGTEGLEDVFILQ